MSSTTPDLRLKTLEDLDDLLADPSPVLVFKHSTACPVSAAAHREFTAWLESDHPKPRTALVLVIEERPVSLELARRIGVTHQSPQAMLLVDGKAVWCASHHDITVEALQEATTR